MELKRLSKKIDAILEEMDRPLDLVQRARISHSNYFFIIELLKRRGYIDKNYTDYIFGVGLENWNKEDLEQYLSSPDKMLQNIEPYEHAMRFFAPEELQKELLDKKVIFIDEQGEWHINREILNVRGGDVNENGNL